MACWLPYGGISSWSKLRNHRGWGKLDSWLATDQDWISKLSALIVNSALRREFGGAGRRRVEQRYTLESGFTQWKKNAQRAQRNRPVKFGDGFHSNRLTLLPSATSPVEEHADVWHCRILAAAASHRTSCRGSSPDGRRSFLTAGRMIQEPFSTRARRAGSGLQSPGDRGFVSRGPPTDAICVRSLRDRI